MPDLLGLVEAVRFGAVPITTFGVGLLLLAAIAIWRSGVLARASGVLFAVGFVLFLPQFFTPPGGPDRPWRPGGRGCIWLTLALWRAGEAPVR